MSERVVATEAALAAIRRVAEAHGEVALFQSGGCCDGSLPLCLPTEEMPVGPGDVKLGEPGGCGFYVDEEQWRRWGEPGFVLDVSPGDPEGFSLPAGAGMHFVTRSP